MSSIGVVLFDLISDHPSEYQGKCPLKTFKACIGEATNNIAEYSALIKALQISVEEFSEHLVIFMDSLLVIQQVKGVFKVTKPHLRKLFLKVKELERDLKKVDYIHIPRDQNQLADSVANEALDESGPSLFGLFEN